MTNSKNNRTIWIYLILILFTVIAYWPVRLNDFVSYDDSQYVTENPNVSDGLTVQNIGWAFTTPHEGNWQPATWISHMLDCQLFGLNAKWHHLHNLLLHLVNTLLLFELMRRMTGAKWRSAFVAAAFALHPMHVESVAWIAERKDVLSGLFWMLVIAAYLRYAAHPKKSRYLLVLSLFIMGLMAKSMLITLPFVLLLLDYWPLGRMGSGQGARSLSSQASPKRLSFGQLVMEKIPLFVLSVCSCIITYFAQQRGGAMGLTERGLTPFSSRMANAMVSYVSYIAKMFVPRDLAVLYPYPYEGLALYKPVTAFVILILITIFVLRLARRKPYLLTGWFWYVGTLVPVIGIVQVGVQAMADHFTYIPYTGLFIIVAWGAHDIFAGWKKRKIVLSILAATTLGGMIIVTRTQVKYWKDSITLYEHAIDVTDNNYMMYIFAAQEHCRKGELEKAADLYRKALEIEKLHTEPSIVDALNNLAWILAACKDEQYRDPAEAVKLAHTACRLTGNRYPALLDTLAVAYAASGQFEKAIDTAQKALRLANGPKDGELRKQIETRILLFRQRQPYVDQ